MISAVLFVIAVGAAMIYAIYFLAPEVSWPRSVIKTIPLTCGALLATEFDAPMLLVFGMVLSAVGDFALSRTGERWFFGGLSAFLAAHLAYIVLFIGLLDDAPWAASIWIAVICLVIYGVAFVAVIWRRLGDKRIPVAAYVATILIMGIAAVATGDLFLIIGALLFIFSDSMLALELFVFTDKPRRWISYAIWETYIAAQAAIALPFLAQMYA